jgi:hypothetical protein
MGTVQSSIPPEARQPLYVPARGDAIRVESQCRHASHRMAHGTNRRSGITLIPSANVAVSRYSSLVLGNALEAMAYSVS